jgi:hypothetical protein
MGCSISCVLASRRLGAPLGTGHTIFLHDTPCPFPSHHLCTDAGANSSIGTTRFFNLARLVRVPLHGRVGRKAAALSPPRQPVSFVAFPHA